MKIFISFLLIFLGIYISYITKWIYGWNKIKKNNNKKDNDNKYKVSIIVAFRNERHNLPVLIECLKKQDYNNFELILIDDNSTDGGFENLNFESLNYKIIKSNGIGKKIAIKRGIKESKGELIICTDADCKAKSNKWISCCVESIKSDLDLAIGPVLMKGNGNLFNRLQCLEFESLEAATGGAAMIGNAIMINGANLTFKKNLWNENIDLKEKEMSGDDMFMLEWCKKKGKKIGYINSKNAVVETSCNSNLKDFINQRSRWAGKSKSYKDKTTIIVAITVFMLCLLILFCGILAINNIYYLNILITVMFIKMIADGWLLIKSADILCDDKKNLLLIPLLSILYPIYVVSVAIKGLCGNYEWKGRKN